MEGYQKLYPTNAQNIPRRHDPTQVQKIKVILDLSFNLRYER